MLNPHAPVCTSVEVRWDRDRVAPIIAGARSKALIIIVLGLSCIAVTL